MSYDPGIEQPLTTLGLMLLLARAFSSGCAALTGVDARTSSDVWAVGSTSGAIPQPYVAHFDGTSWSRMATPAVAGGGEQLDGDRDEHFRLHRGVGAVTETDILLARAAGAIIIGFHVRPDNNARAAAERGVDLAYEV